MFTSMKILFKSLLIVTFLVLLSSCTEDEIPGTTDQDTEGPVVVSVSPTDKSSDISILTNVTITFSESVDAATATGGAISLKNGSNTVNASISATNETVTLNPVENLEYSTDYTLVIGAGVTDEAGNRLSGSSTLSFTTEDQPDGEAPTLISILPENGAEDVAIDQEVVITFSEAIAEASVNTSSISLTANDEAVVGSFTVAEEVVTFTPASLLQYETTFTLTIGEEVEDLNQNTHANSRTFTFTTVPEPDTESPTVVSVSPADKAVDIALDSPILITFSETLDAATISDESVILSSTNETSIATNITLEDHTMTIQPVANLEDDVVHTLSLPAGKLKDQAGNGIEASFVTSFTTIYVDDVPPQIDRFSIVNDAPDVSADGGITITFTEPLNPETLDGNIRLRRSEGTEYIDITLTSNEKEVVVTPVKRLTGLVKHTLEITTGVEDLAGNNLPSAKSRSFTTETVDLEIINQEPADASTDIEIDQILVYTFSEPVDASTIGAYILGSNPGFDISVSGNKVSFIPKSPWKEFGTSYSLILDGGIKDIYGNKLIRSKTLTFKTIYLSNKYYYSIRNFEQSGDLAINLPGSNLALTGSRGVARLWRVHKVEGGYAIENKYYSEINTNMRYLYSAGGSLALRGAPINSLGTWTFSFAVNDPDSPIDYHHMSVNNERLTAGEKIYDLNFKNDVADSDGYGWWKFIREDKIN